MQFGHLLGYTCRTLVLIILKLMCDAPFIIFFSEISLFTISFNRLISSKMTILTILCTSLPQVTSHKCPYYVVCSPSSSFSPLGISSSLLGRSLPFSSRQKAFRVDSLWTLDNARHNDPLRMQMSENSAETNWRCISQLFRNLRSLSFFKTSSYCPVLRN